MYLVERTVRWLAKYDSLTYGLQDIIDLPVPTNQRHFRINKNQFTDIQQTH